MKKAGTLIFLIGALVYGLLGQNTPTVTIQKSNIKVGELLKEITRQSGADFSYNSNLLDPEKDISFFVKKASLTKTLDKLCQKISLSYVLVEGQIVLNPPKKVIPPKEEYITLAGFLSDLSTGESLIGGTIFSKGTSRGTFTNEFGYYALSLKPGKHTIIFSHIGFKKKILELSLEKSQQKNIALPTMSFDLPAVVIAPPLDDILNKKQLGQLELTPVDLKKMPEFAGEPGIVNGMQSLPGIKTHGDGSAYFYTRGGERDQNIIFIDDAPIYNPSHLFGFYSIFVPDFTKSISIYKSDMPAMVGDRLSSIISIRTKDGNLNKFEMNGAINPFVNRLSFETPIRKGKSSIFVTLRRSNFDWVYKRSNPNLDAKFNDFHIKWNRKLNDKNRLFFTTIWSADVLENGPIGGKTNVTWANFAATLRWNHIFSPKLFSNTTIYTGNFANRLSLRPNFWKSNLGMLSIKTDFTHYANAKFYSKFGMEIQGYFNDPGSISLDTTLGIFPSLKPNYSRKTVLYYQGNWNIRERLNLKAGLRAVSWSSLGPTPYFKFDRNHQVVDTAYAGRGVYNAYFNPDPRISLQYRLTHSSQLKLSFGRYHQYLQMVSNSISPFTALELWLPASTNIKPQRSRQWALSYLNYFEESKMEISAALYHKKMFNQIDYEGHAVTYLNPLIEGELRFGSTRAYGLELMIKKDFGRVNGWLSYNYSRAFKETRGINNNEEYLAFQDRPHDFSLLLNFQKSRRVLYSAYWTSYSGSPFTSPTGFLNFNDQTVPIYGQKNNDRLPAYHRLDASVQWNLNKDESKRFQHTLTLSVNNLLMHKNVYAVKFNRIPDPQFGQVIRTNVLSENRYGATEVSLIRIFPSLSYRFKL